MDDKSAFIKEELQHKLQTDFAESALTAPWQLKEQAKVTQSNLSIIKEVSVLDLEQLAKISKNSWDGITNQNSVNIVKDTTDALGRPLNIDCACLYAACFSVLNSIAQDFTVPISIEDKNASGYEQAINLADAAEGYDFIPAADAPFSLVQNDELKDYLRFFDLTKEIQHAFKFKGQSTNAQPTFWIYPHSSVEHQVRIAKAEPEKFNLPSQFKEESLKSLADYQSLEEFMKPGDYIFAWQPLSSGLQQRNDVELVPGTKFELSISMYYHKRFLNNPEFLDAFLDLFISRWNYLHKNQIEAFQVISDDQSLLSNFARAAGLH